MGRLLNRPLAPVLPLRLCAVPGPLYTVLMGYKEAPVDLARRRFVRIVGAHFAAYLHDHARCVVAALGGEVDAVLPVPSTSRPGGASLELVEGLGDLAGHALGSQVRWMPSLLGRTGVPVGPMRPDAHAFACPDRSVVGSRVVLLDDTYVSGARAQSAATALRGSGAQSVLILPVGRVLRPDRLEAHAAYLARARSGAIAGRCARCVGHDRPVGSEGDQFSPAPWGTRNARR